MIVLFPFALLGLIWSLFGGIDGMKIEESTATAFEYGGKYCQILFQQEGKHLENGYIRRGEGSKKDRSCPYILQLWGGLVIYLSWFVSPAQYDKHNDEDGFGKGHQIFLNDIQKDFTLSKSETKTGEGTPLDITGVFDIRIVNPYKFMYKAPRAAIARTVKKIEGIVRAYITVHSVIEVQECKSNGKDLWAEILKSKSSKRILKHLLTRWGILIVRETIIIMDVGLQQADQDATAAKKRQRQQAAAEAQELVGSMLENVAAANGLVSDPESKQNGKSAAEKAIELLKQDAEGRKLLATMLEKANDTVLQRKLGTGYRKFDVPGLSELVAVLVKSLRP